jgi:hypothetical protein
MTRSAPAASTSTARCGFCPNPITFAEALRAAATSLSESPTMTGVRREDPNESACLLKRVRVRLHEVGPAWFSSDDRADVPDGADGCTRVLGRR